MSLAEYFAPFSGVRFPKIPDFSGFFGRQAHVAPYEIKAIPASKPVIAPAHWTTELMPFKGSYVPCYISRATNEHFIVGLATGMSSYPLEWQDEIDLLNIHGVSVVSIGLLQTENYAEYYDVNRALMKTFFLDENCSPLYRTGDKNLGRHAVTHSTACPFLIDSLSMDGVLKGKPTNLLSATYLNPFMDTYRSSCYYHPVKNTIYSAFMTANGKKGIGMTDFEHWYMGDKDTDHLPTLYGRPENARVKKTRARVRALNREIWAGRRADISSFPQKMYLGTRDYCICAETTESLAQTMEIDTQHFDADHFKMMQTPEAFKNILYRLREIEGSAAPSPQRSRISKSSSFGLTLQGGARALDTIARLG